MSDLCVELPDLGVEAVVTLFHDRAPSVCRSIVEALTTPLETRTAHACFDGHAVYAYLPEFSQPPPVENSTMRPTPGDVMFYRAPVNSFAWLHDDRDRMAPRGTDVEANELSFIYGAVNLTHDLGAAFYGSLIGRVTAGFHSLAEAFAETLERGNTALKIHLL